MKSFVRAILNLAAFVELSPDEVIDPDAAVGALEQLANDLLEASPAELSYMKSMIIQEINEAPDDRTPDEQARITFLLDFMETLEGS